MSDVLNKASLVLIPSGYKEDKIYSVIPTNGDGDLTFTRASDATRVNSAGLVERVPWNLVKYSEQFDNATWLLYQSSIISNTTTAPNGTTTADSLIENNATDVHIVYQFVTISAGVYTISTYAKANGRNHITLYSYDNIGVFYFSNPFNLSNGTTTGANQSIESVGDGWYKCSYTFTTTVTGTHYFYIGLNNGTGINYAGDGVSGAYVWGYQVNEGTLKPYFPTTDRLNVPRLDYSGGSCPSLLLEPQRTNLTLYSEDLGNAVHNLLNVTIASNNTTSPDGTQNADKFTETTATGEHIIYDLQINSAGVYTISCFLKQGSGTIYPVLRLNNTFSGDYALIIFDFTSGTVINTSNVGYGTPTYTVANLGNGWYRVTMTCTTTGTFGGLRLAASNSATPSFGGSGLITYTGSTSNYFYAYGAQLEAGSYPTSYIPTTSSSATRVADVVNGAVDANLFNDNEGVLFVEFSALADIRDNEFRFLISDGTNNERVQIGLQTNNTLYCSVIVSNSAVADFTTSLSSPSSNHKVAIKYKSNDFAAYVDGVHIGTDTSGATPSGLDRLDFYRTPNNNNYVEANVKKTIYFPTALTNSELASLTGNQNYTINQAYASYGVASESPNCVQP